MTTINVLMVGTGEYTTGYVHGAPAKSDKSAGVVALTLFDLRRRGWVDRLAMAGSNGTKFPGVRSHLKSCIAEIYQEMDITFESFPNDDVESDPQAYRKGLETMNEGDAVIVFTPDDLHYPIALDAVRRGCHVLIAKPIVKTLSEHLELLRAANEHNVLVAMEVHKRWDPIYADARDRIRTLGDFSFFQSYMSQPKSQLDTFRAWAGQASDISYYLNAHHVDFHAWSVASRARPVTVTAIASTGCAQSMDIPTEDTITLAVQWENQQSSHLGTALYTACWIAPPSDVHSQQRFFYMGHDGEITVDQAHRGYTLASDKQGYSSANPLFMKYTPDADGFFAGRAGYGYRSIADFIAAARAIREGRASVDSFRDKLATIQDTVVVTAILEAGRRSLDQQGRQIRLVYEGDRVVDLD